MRESLQTITSQTAEELDFVPRTKEEIENARKNREALAKITYASAQVVKDKLKTEESLTVPMGATSEGQKVNATVTKIQGLAGTLRINVTVDDEPKATYAYGTGWRPTGGNGYPTHVMEEKPGSNKAGGIGGLSKNSVDNVRTLRMQSGNGGGIYSTVGREAIDVGAMDYTLVAEVLSLAAAPAPIETHVTAGV